MNDNITKLKAILMIILGLIVIAVFAVLFAFPFMWLWNFSVVAALTIAKPIDYPVALGLMILIGWMSFSLRGKVKAE